VVRGDLLGVLDEVGDHGFHRQIDTALQVHRVHAGGNRLGAFTDDRSRENRRGGGAVAGRISGLRSDFAHHLRAHVLELVVELDLLGGGDVEHAHDVALLHDQEIFTVDLDLGARPLAEQDAVADLEVDRDQLAGFVAATGAYGGDFALRGLFLGTVRNDDAASGLL